MAQRAGVAESEAVTVEDSLDSVETIAAATEEARKATLEFRERNWMMREWGISARGNPVYHTGTHVCTIFPHREHPEFWSCSIWVLDTGEVHWAELVYADEEAARLGCFVGLMELLDAEYDQ